MSTQPAGAARSLVPELLAGLVDDASAFPLGAADLAELVRAHREHRAAWYAGLLGRLLIPASMLGEAGQVLEAVPDTSGAWRPEVLDVGVVGDTGPTALAAAVAGAGTRLRIRQVEVAAAKRGEDPQPGLRRIIAALAELPGVTGYAEVPLTWGLLGALDTVAVARADGVPVGAKFRTGGLAGELFPTPVELAAVICACRDRRVPFKLTAGLHRAVRHTDRETSFVHHGFLNVLVATAVAADGGEVADVAEVLGGTDAGPLVAQAVLRQDGARPLWAGFGSSSIVEPLTDLVRLGLIDGGYE